jgi:hypothetical protein
MMAESAKKSLNANEGEGSRTAARRYNEGVAATVRGGKVETKAREAARAVAGPEGRALRRAEEVGKKGVPAKKR